MVENKLCLIQRKKSPFADFHAHIAESGEVQRPKEMIIKIKAEDELRQLTIKKG